MCEEFGIISHEGLFEFTAGFIRGDEYCRKYGVNDIGKLVKQGRVYYEKGSGRSYLGLYLDNPPLPRYSCRVCRLEDSRYLPEYPLRMSLKARFGETAVKGYMKYWYRGVSKQPIVSGSYSVRVPAVTVTFFNRFLAMLEDVQSYRRGRSLYKEALWSFPYNILRAGLEREDVGYLTRVYFHCRLSKGVSGLEGEDVVFFEDYFVGGVPMEDVARKLGIRLPTAYYRSKRLARSLVSATGLVIVEPLERKAVLGGSGYVASKVKRFLRAGDGVGLRAYLASLPALVVFPLRQLEAMGYSGRSILDVYNAFVGGDLSGDSFDLAAYVIQEFVGDLKRLCKCLTKV